MLVNWPPSKGEKPPHLQHTHSYVIPKMRRWDKAAKITKAQAAERRELLEAVWDHHNDPKVIEEIATTYSAPKSGKKKAEKFFILNYHVDTVASLSVMQASRLIHGNGLDTKSLCNLLPVRPLTVTLDYPLSTAVELEVKPCLVVRKWGDGKQEDRDCMTLGYFLWVVAQEYRRIYADWKYYKPWGHGIEDLFFENLEVKRGGKVVIGVGS